MNCDCIENINKTLTEHKKKEVKLAIILTLRGSYPYLYAECGKKKIIVEPLYCPFCGKKYEGVENER